jgi:glycosyltransferase involved in cell wall biosynthesis
MVPKIDVIMPTWNSNRPFFKRVIELIKCYVPVHKFIIVDRYSTDGTLEVIKEYFPNAIIIQTNSNLALARKIGIRYADCEIISFIDDDVFISEKWFYTLYFLMKLFPTIGMVYPLYGLIRPGDKLIEVLRKRNDVNIKSWFLGG